MKNIKWMKKGFTLIELLVVIAVIALLMAIIVPSLKKAKEMAAAAVCLSNEGQLVKAYIMYAEDHDQFITDGDTADAGNNGYATYGGVRVHCWVGEPENGNQTLDDKAEGFEAGSLWAYLQAPKVYNCPADKRWRKQNENGYGINGYRTYSIGNPLSRRPGNVGESEAEIKKMTEFVTPGDKIIFLEETEKEYGWNNKTWNIYLDLSNPQWGDPFAILHNGSSTFGFADGHADRHKWVDKATIELAEAGEKGPTSATLADGSTSEDYLWFRRAYIPGRARTSY